MKICPVCTNENPDTNKFCNFCGAQLSDVEPAESNGTEADPLSEIMAKMQSQEKTADPVRSGPVENNANPPAGPANYQPAQQGGYQPAGPAGYQPAQQNGYPPAGPAGYQPAQQGGYPPAGPAGYQPAQQGGYPPAGPNNYQQAQQGGYPPAGPNNYQPAQQGGYPPAGPNNYQQAQQGGYPSAGPNNYQQAQQGGYPPAGPNNYQQTRQGSGNMGRNNNNPQQYTYSPTPFDSKIPEVPIGGYIAWAVVDILFSLLFGILGLVFVLKINKSETPEEQQKNIKYAKIFLIIGSAIGVLNLVIMFISNSL